MKIFVTLVFTLFLSLNATAQTHLIKLDKSKKIIESFSGELGNNESFHLVFYKDRKTKKKSIIPFFINTDGELIRLEDFTYNDRTALISYHQARPNTFTLLFAVEKEKKLLIVDFDVITKKSNISTIATFKDMDLTFRLADKTIFVDYDNKNQSYLNITEVYNYDNYKTTKVTPFKEDKVKFRKIFMNGVDVIDTQELVEKGSTKNTKAYFEKGDLIFDNFDEKNIKSTLMTLKLDDKQTIFKEFTNPEIRKKYDRIKNGNSYYYRGKIFYIINTKENVFVFAKDIVTGKDLFKIDFNTILSAYFDTNRIKKYIKNTRRSFYKPTITVNPTLENNLLLTLNYVDTRTYYYDNNWMFQQMMMQQMMQPPPMPHFGPNITDGDIMNYYITEPEAFKIVLDKNFNIDNNLNPKTPFESIDKKKYTKQLKENSNIKHSSIAFTKSSIRSLWYQRINKSLVFSVKNF